MDNKNNISLKIGVGLILLSIPFFIGLFILPFLTLATETKLIVAPILLVIGEILFWVGGFFAGKEVFTKYKNYLNPVNWFKKKDKNDETY